MTDLASADYFTDQSLAQNPFEYFAALREQNPVYREPHHNVVIVTGHPEVIEAFKNSESLSAVNAIGGPFPPYRSSRKATTSPRRSTRIAICSRSPST